MRPRAHARARSESYEIKHCVAERSGSGAEAHAGERSAQRARESERCWKQSEWSDAWCESKAELAKLARLLLDERSSKPKVCLLTIGEVNRPHRF